jgi:PKHD-type hydroxylase
MLVTLESVLAPAQLVMARSLLADGEFADGRASAGEQARRHKRNEELVADAAAMSALNNLVMGALVRHPVYLNAGLPHRIAAPYYSRYGKGMHYGQHVDDPVMGQGPDPTSRYRCDVAITIFLSDPADYDGGELVVHTSFGPQSIRLPAGHGVMYPASSLHEVTRVTRGERLAAVTWMQSLVPAAEQRELLYRLWQARETLRREQPDSAATQRVDQSYLNLVRMWSGL